MKVTIEVELRPFTVPNYVVLVGKPGLKQDGMKELPSYPLRDLDSESLDKLCGDFRAEVFRKAVKADPLTTRQGLLHEALEWIENSKESAPSLCGDIRRALGLPPDT